MSERILQIGDQVRLVVNPYCTGIIQDFNTGPFAIEVTVAPPQTKGIRGMVITDIDFVVLMKTKEQLEEETLGLDKYTKWSESFVEI
jgi:hypothetical protein